MAGRHQKNQWLRTRPRFWDLSGISFAVEKHEIPPFCEIISLYSCADNELVNDLTTV
jgi:hypothetical protein